MFKSENRKINPTQHAVAAARAHSPYLSRLLDLYPDIPESVAASADKAVSAVMSSLPQNAAMETADLMRGLRIAKGKLALLAALADIGGAWPLEKVTAALSDFAGRAAALALDHLLLAAHAKGEIILPHPETPSRESGLFLLAMGKLGAHELNYSSDIDLMVFFERGALSYQGRHNEQHFMNTLAHGLVEILQERTAEGYVFRTDLRLRPDPASTPPAISTAAALYYYESVGQNWERAAMIKARPVGGDLAAGGRFLANVSPFMWRRSLDFAAIQDIHSIKRQMDARQSKDIQVAGHHIKLGIGGIREIEFFAQIHQLIWGGREPSLRVRGTCEALAKLEALKLVAPEAVRVLSAAYIFLRTLEHRLQMVADQQTHELPRDDAGITNIAAFMGYDSRASFEKDLLAHLHAVHGIYASSFQSSEKLGEAGNLVFTGVHHDPDTLKTLTAMGYANPETVSEIVMGWHHGSARATRTKRARELLTELMPALLGRIAETANPDAAFLKFNDFLVKLPAGVQLFSLFQMNPQLLGLIADIFGSAPTLAGYLSRTPGLLDAVLYEDFYAPLPEAKKLAAQWKEIAGTARDFEDRMHLLTRFRNEKQFQAGVHLLKNMATAKEAGHFLAELADLAVAETLQAATAEFEKTYGKIKGGGFAVIALGKLGSREMTFSSDIDLVFVYDAPDMNASSSGGKPLGAGVYYSRLSQRVLTALTAMGREGKLYEVDTRLRPSGAQGPLATSLDGLEHYFSELAWTFEYMAFTKARPVAGDKKLSDRLAEFIGEQISKRRDMEKLRADAVDMRERIDKEFHTDNIWNIKYVRGGLIDIDFIAQYLLLRHAPEHKGAAPGAAGDIFFWLKEKNILSKADAGALLAADLFLGQMLAMLRLSGDDAFDEAAALPGLKKLLCQAVDAHDFEALKAQLLAVEQTVRGFYTSFLHA